MLCLVYVVNQNGHGLMPCKPSKARKLLRDGRARVKGTFVKQINSIYSNGYLAFPRARGEPAVAQPKDCVLLERGTTVLWQKLVGYAEKVENSL